MASKGLVTTPREQARQARILEAAQTMLAQEGEQGLQMKQLAQRADVALATLYRYFPSKDHVLGAIALERWKRASQRIEALDFDGDTPGERAGEMMVREFHRVQRDPEIAAALERVANTPDRSTSEYMDGIRRIALRLVQAAIERGGATITAEQLQMLPIFMAASGGAINHWLAGVISAAQARAQIRAAARLFDLPAAVVREYLWVD
jgi:AcrR family transcriptional regulator